MNNITEDEDAEDSRAVNKATMDQPQEEFIAPDSRPSRRAGDGDQEHGDEVEGAAKRHAGESADDSK